MKSEAFMYGGDNLHQALADMFTRHINGARIPDDWREGVLMPIHKKGPTDDPNNYRGLTICNPSYKLYSKLLLIRLEAELEEKGTLPDNQAGYRKNRSGIDNIYIADTVIKSRS